MHRYSASRSHYLFNFTHSTSTTYLSLSRSLHTSAAIESKTLFPSVRRLLTENKLDQNQITATGPKGRILKGDVISFLEKGLTQTVTQTNTTKPSTSNAPNTQTQTQIKPTTIPPPSIEAKKDTTTNKSTPITPNFEEIPNSNIRRVIAKRLTESKTTVPHYYIAKECEIDNILSLRATLNTLGQGKTKISVNDFFIKACALTLRDVPSLNVLYSNNGPQPQKSIDISVAVATDRGLFTPIVKEADKKTLGIISEDVRTLAQKAKEGKLKPEEFQGGSFSISNLGMFGISEFVAVINPPQAAIIAVGTGKKKLVENNNSLKTVTVVDMSLSFDSRIVDEENAAKFLDVLGDYLAHPEKMV